MKKYLLVVVMLLVPGFAFGSTLPLVTDDAVTIGKGKFDVDVTYNVGFDSDVTASNVAAKVTYGVAPNVDVIIEQPWSYVSFDGTGHTKGFNDTVVASKYKFGVFKGIDLAAKASLSLPTADEFKGFGPGKVNLGVSLLATKPFAWGAVHANAGYTTNANDFGLNKNILNGSIAAEYIIIKNLVAVADFGVATNLLKDSDANTYLLGGVNYKITPKASIALGVKGGLSGSLANTTLLTGFTYKF